MTQMFCTSSDDLSVRNIGAPVSGMITVLLLSVIFIALSMNAAHARSASIYTFAKVKLDVRADNAVVAKKQALEEGPLQALKQIFKRFAPFRAYDRLDKLTSKEADELVDGFAVRSERNSPTRYLALLDYNFSEKKLQAFFTRKGVPFFDRRSDKQVLMPVFGSLDENNPDAKASKRNWWRAWRTIDMKHALTDSRLYKAKNSDHAIWQKIAAGEFEHYDLMRKNYTIGKLVLASAQLNQQKNALTLRLFGEDSAGSIDYSQTMPVSNGLKEAYEAAAQIAFAIIEGRWREPHITGEVVAVAVDVGTQDANVVGKRLVEETIFLRVAFRGLRDWQQIRKKLQRVPGVQRIQVNSLSPRGADVRIEYPGGVQRFRSQASSYGFTLEQREKELILKLALR